MAMVISVLCTLLEIEEGRSQLRHRQSIGVICVVSE